MKNNNVLIFLCMSCGILLIYFLFRQFALQKQVLMLQESMNIEETQLPVQASPVVNETITPPSQQPKISPSTQPKTQVDTSGWKTESYKNLTMKIPSDYTRDNQFIKKGDWGVFGLLIIDQDKGNSRRVQYLGDNFDAKCYSFEDKVLGGRAVLQVTVKQDVCPENGTSNAYLLVVGKTFVAIGLYPPELSGLSVSQYNLVLDGFVANLKEN